MEIHEIKRPEVDKERSYLSALSNFQPKFISSYNCQEYQSADLESEFEEYDNEVSCKLFFRYCMLTEVFGTIGTTYLLIMRFLTWYILAVIAALMIARWVIILIINQKLNLDVPRKKLVVIYLFFYLISFIISVPSVELLVSDDELPSKSPLLIRAIWVGAVLLYFGFCAFCKVTLLKFFLLNSAISLPLWIIFFNQVWTLRVYNFAQDIICNFFIYAIYFFLMTINMRSRERFEMNKKNDFLINNYKTMIKHMGCSLIAIEKNIIVYVNPTFESIVNSFTKGKFEVYLRDSCEATLQYMCSNYLKCLFGEDQQPLLEKVYGSNKFSHEFEWIGHYELNLDLENKNSETEINIINGQSSSNTNINKSNNSSKEDKYTFFSVYIRKIELINGSSIIELIMHDLTSLKKYKEESLITKSTKRVFSNIAHEFKTPLISITSLVQSLDDLIKAKVSYNRILEVSSQLCHISEYTMILINDIILYSTSNQKMGNLKLVNETFKLMDLIQFCNNMLACLIESKEKINKVEVILEADQIINDIQITSDETRLKQILLNFISNAVKFTNTGSIRIKSWMDDISKEVRLEIRDTGCGMTQSNLEKLSSTDINEILEVNLTKDNRMGTGLGLKLAFNLCKRMNLSTFQSSIIGKGTAFGIIIKDYIMPFNTCKSSQSVKSSFSITKKLSCHRFFEHINFENEKLERYPLSFDTELRKILVVDDVPNLRKSISRQLCSIFSKKYFEIIELKDGVDAINFMIHECQNENLSRVEYAFCDENMAYLNGSWTFNLIKNIEKENKISFKYKLKLILVTAENFNIDMDEIERTKRLCNADFIFNKPLSSGELHELKILSEQSGCTIACC